MQYGKGDTIELYEEKMAIVLDNGMSGVELVMQYHGKIIIELFKSHPPLVRYALFNGAYIQDRVWYKVLAGDKTGWVAVPKPLYSIGDKL